MKKALRFKNFSNEDFTGIWDKKEYKFKPGESLILPDYLAIHFAKHLVDRELTKQDKPINSQNARDEMASKCLTDIGVSGNDDVELEVAMLNADDKPEEEDKKEDKPKQNKTKQDKPKDDKQKNEVKEDEFKGK